MLLSLCALHCEMRNTEEMLKSVGLLAYEIGSLPECNAKLSDYGPSNFKADRITVKLRPGQETAPGRNNVSFASCSGYSKIIISIILICLLGHKKIQSCQTALGFFTFLPCTFISTVFNVKNESKETVSLWQNCFKTNFVTKVIIKKDCCKMLHVGEGIRGFLDC